MYVHHDYDMNAIDGMQNEKYFFGYYNEFEYKIEVYDK